jgi:hypothetical protein
LIKRNPPTFIVTFLTKSLRKQNTDLMKNMGLLCLTVFPFFLLLPLVSPAQVDTIRVNDHRLRTSNLPPGLNQYLVYTQDPAKKKTLGFWYWLRRVQVARRGQEKVFVITQHWLGSDTNAYRSIVSVNRAGDFAPLYHCEWAHGKLKAYNWAGDQITGADSVSGNVQKDFRLAFQVPNFNWNLDIETFEMLPLAAGKTFALNFYDAGLDLPRYVNYKVVGSEVIQTTDNHQVDCWKLFTESDYPGGHFSETYWISKEKHEFLKEEDKINDTYRYKIKMPAAAPDLMERFGR